MRFSPGRRLFSCSPFSYFLCREMQPKTSCAALFCQYFRCAFRHAGDLDKQEEYCLKRVNANWIGSLHVFALTSAGIMLTSTDGSGFDVLAAMRLDLSWPDRIEGVLVAAASMIALFLFSTREEEGTKSEKSISLLKYIFMGCWLLATLTVAFTSEAARESRLRFRKETDKRARDAAAPVNTVAGAILLPRTWSYIMILLTCLSYTVPQAVRLVFLQYEGFRGVIGGFSNLCLVGHILMVGNTSSALHVVFTHFSVHILGVACSFGTALRTLGFTAGLMFSYFVGAAGILLELWLWMRVVKPLLASRNPTLLAKLPITAFRWLFQRGGLNMGLYCYFEALGVGFSDRAFEDIHPWLISNNTVLAHLTFSTALSITLLADSRATLHALLRGLAPLHVKLGLFIVIVTSLIPLIMFAGRDSAIASSNRFIAPRL